MEVEKTADVENEIQIVAVAVEYWQLDIAAGQMP